MFEITPAHRAIFDAVEARESNFLVSAVAGSGKTSTIIEALRLIPRDEKVLFLAFNKSIAAELEKRTPDHVEVRTMNALGHRAWASHLYLKGEISSRGGLKLDAQKVSGIASRLRREGYLSDTQFFAFAVRATKLVSLVKSAGLRREEVTHDDWWALIDRFDIELADTPDAFRETTRIADIILRESLEYRTEIDFDDQLYFPFVADIHCPKYDRIIVDEAQDLSPLQHDLIDRHLGTDSQLIAVGDPHQAIYGFRGADSRSMATLGARFNAVELPLHVSYRCPRVVVDLAQQVVSHIQPHADAPLGVVVEPVTLDKAEIKPGDMIVSRTNAPMISLAYALIKQGMRVEVLGREIGKGLLGLIKKLKPRDVEDLDRKAVTWLAKETKKALTRESGAAKIMAISDKVECLFALTEEVSTLDELISLIESLFSGVRDDTKVCLCTVHKSKGLEAERVWILNRDQMPHRAAKQDWQLEQENNLIYVALTRAKHQIGFLVRGQR